VRANGYSLRLATPAVYLVHPISTISSLRCTCARKHARTHARTRAPLPLASPLKFSLFLPRALFPYTADRVLDDEVTVDGIGVGREERVDGAPQPRQPPAARHHHRHAAARRCSQPVLVEGGWRVFPGRPTPSQGQAAGFGRAHVAHAHPMQRAGLYIALLRIRRGLPSPYPIPRTRPEPRTPNPEPVDGTSRCHKIRPLNTNLKRLMTHLDATRGAAPHPPLTRFALT